jgi:hypothetical protein
MLPVSQTVEVKREQGSLGTTTPQMCCSAQENSAMMILMLAAAMTIAMLIATVFGLHQEAQRVRQSARSASMNRFGLQRRQNYIYR